MITDDQKQAMLGHMLKLNSPDRDEANAAVDGIREILDEIDLRQPPIAKQKADARAQRTVWIDSCGEKYAAYDDEGKVIPDTLAASVGDVDRIVSVMSIPDGHLEHVQAIAIMAPAGWAGLRMKGRPQTDTSAVQPSARPKRRMRAGNNEES
jgi:hypothetical protein